MYNWFKYIKQCFYVNSIIRHTTSHYVSVINGDCENIKEDVDINPIIDKLYTDHKLAISLLN